MSDNKGCLVYICFIAAILFLLSRPGVVKFLNSTYSDFSGKPAKKSIEEIEDENAVMREALSELSSRLDELYFDASDISDNLTPAWSYLNEHDFDNEITKESAGNDLEDASCDLDSLMQEILELESFARKSANSFSKY